MIYDSRLFFSFFLPVWCLVVIFIHYYLFSSILIFFYLFFYLFYFSSSNFPHPFNIHLSLPVDGGKSFTLETTVTYRNSGALLRCLAMYNSLIGMVRYVTLSFRLFLKIQLDYLVKIFNDKVLSLNQIPLKHIDFETYHESMQKNNTHVI